MLLGQLYINLSAPSLAKWFIPPLLLVLTGFARMFSRRPLQWKPDDWYLGPELCIAASAESMIYFFDVLHNYHPGSTDSAAMSSAASLALMCLMATAFFTFHTRRTADEKKGRMVAILMLGVASNLSGLALLVAALLRAHG